MAEKEMLDEELDLGAEKKKAPIKKIIILVLAGLLAVGIGSGATWWAMSSDKKVQTADDEVEAEEEDVEEEEEEPLGPPLYHALEPAFVVNLPPGGKTKMMQIQVQLMTRKPEMLEFLKHNDPMIRHSLLALFSVQNADNLREREGKEKLQQEVLVEVQKVADAENSPGEVEAVYFTGFVMQ